MAATVSPWSKPGAWALEAEENEAELLKQHNESESAADFPTLNAAVATKPSKKKKKGQTVTLQEFAAYGGPKPSSDSSGLTPDDLVSLPKGPRERTEEEIARASRGGGGFRSFDRGGAGEESRWGGAGSGRGGDRERRDGGREVRDLGPSRADEVDNWASSKKPSMMSGGGYERRERDGGRERERGGFFDSQSKADESDSWVSNKSYAPAPRFDRDRRGGPGMGFGSSNGSSDSDFWGKKREESNGGGAEIGTGSRPRLNLQPRTLPVASNPAPESVEKPEIAAFVAVPKPKGANPFGAARPREEVLAEKGQDWKKIDEQLESMKIKETGERFGKQRSFGSGNGRADAAWKKPETAAIAGADANSVADDGDAQSAEKNEDKAVEEQN